MTFSANPEYNLVDFHRKMSDRPTYLPKADILVVDDTPDNLRLLIEILVERGYKVRPASNGPRALAVAKTEPPDLILLDILMPEMNGYEVCQRLKTNKHTRDIPVIFISALNEVLDKVLAEHEGAVDYITKPFQVEEVVARVENQLSIRQLQKQLRQQNDLLQQEIRQRQQIEAALKVEQQQLRQIVTHAPVAMAMFDRQMRYIAHSNKWLTDYNLINQTLIGRSQDEVLPDLPEQWRWIYQQALQGATISNPEELWERANGEKICLHWAIQPWYTPNGEIGGIVLATDRIDSLVKARETALEAARVKSQFLATMSHEIRTPMNGVLGMTELLIGTDLSPQQLDFVQTLKTSAENLQLIINDILDFSKLEAGEMRLSQQQFNLIASLEEVVNLLATQANDKGLELLLLVDNSVPVFIQGDSGRLRQVLINLLGNAIKFTDTGFVLIKVKLSSLTSDTVCLYFEVEDTGIGISPKDQKKLFQGFSQVHETTIRVYGGTGLGLAICKQLTELMEGEIGVNSDLGKGSRFWFTANFQLLTDEQTNNYPDPAIRNRRLLVVDERAQSREVLCFYANSWGLDVTAAENRTAALVTLRQGASNGCPYDVVILSLDLLQEKVLSQQLKFAVKVGKIAKLIVLANFQQQEQAIRLQFDKIACAYLIKPVIPSKLLASLQTALGSSSWIPSKTTNWKESTTTTQELNENLIILLVEDTLVNQKVITHQLKRLGYDTDCANNGEEALKKLEKTNYNLILMDCQMPVLDGYQTTQAIRLREGQKQHRTIIGLTAYAMKGDRQKCLKAGMDDYLSKPVTLKELNTVIQKWIKVRNNCSKSNTVEELIDLEQLTRISRGDQEHQKELLECLVESVESSLAGCKEALETANHSLLVMNAHRIKGGSAHVGVNSMSNLAASLESQAEEKQLEGAETKIASLEEILEQVKVFIAQNW